MGGGARAYPETGDDMGEEPNCNFVSVRVKKNQSVATAV
jgi:hypothetical protein